jgi:hypothetical protein
MASPSNYPNGFPAGIAIRGVPILQTHPGKVFYVDNSTPGNGDNFVNGSNGNKGTFKDPFATIAYAISQARASKGDIIIVKPGHAETITAAGGLVLSKAGVAIIGLGMGSMRPTISLGTATSASITVTANNVTVSNILFLSTLLNVATVFNIANAQVANDLTIDNCEFVDTSAILNFVSVLTIGTTANISDGLTFTGNRIIGKASTPAAATTAIVTASDAIRWTISGNYCSHQVLLAATAVLIAAGSTNIANSLVQKNIVVRPNTDASNPLMISNSGTSWLGTMIADNYAGQLSGATGLLMNVSSKASFINNYAMVTGAADKSALINPAAV